VRYNNHNNQGDKGAAAAAWGLLRYEYEYGQVITPLVNELNNRSFLFYAAPKLASFIGRKQITSKIEGGISYVQNRTNSK
jgi:hypothetical protein